MNADSPAPNYRPLPYTIQVGDGTTTLFDLTLARLFSQGHVRPLPGKCILALGRLPDTIGSIHVPDSARDLKLDNIGYWGEVLAVTGRKNARGEIQEEEFGPGDRVWVLLRAEEIDKRVIIVENVRVMGVEGK